MKSMLELLKEQKSMTELAIARMKETATASTDFLCDNEYPTCGTLEERTAYVDKSESLRLAKEAAFKTATRRLVSFGEFLGCKVEKKDLEYEFHIESRFSDLKYYCERLEKTFAYNVESYNSYK